MEKLNSVLENMRSLVAEREQLLERNQQLQQETNQHRKQAEEATERAHVAEGAKVSLRRTLARQIEGLESQIRDLHSKNHQLEEDIKVEVTRRKRQELLVQHLQKQQHVEYPQPGQEGNRGSLDEGGVATLRAEGEDVFTGSSFQPHRHLHQRQQRPRPVSPLGTMRKSPTTLTPPRSPRRLCKLCRSDPSSCWCSGEKKEA